MFESEFLTNSSASRAAYRRAIADAVEIVAGFIPDCPYSGKAAAALSELVPDDFLPDAPQPASVILSAIVQNSVHVDHPLTLAHLHCPPLLSALAAEVVITALNQSMDSFDQAPIATVVEQKLIRWLCAETGFPASASGTFTTGGSQSNYMGLLLARDVFVKKHWNCSAQKSGLPLEARRLRILCSEVAHFTVERSASQLGLGSDAVVKVATDDHFRMNPAALRDALASLRASGLLPMAIVATAGTTDFGSIDPLAEVASLAREAGAWLHVDAAYGGALLFSPAHRNMLRGIDSADSITIDFHKLLWQPIPCSAFLLRDTAHFESIKLYADYLNPEFHEAEGIPNLVTTSLLTSRRFDALKLWVSLHTLGREQLAVMVERTIELATRAAEVVNATPSLELITDPQLSTVIFRYRPANPADSDAVNAALRQHLFDRGVAVIGHTRVRHQQCLKLTVMNPAIPERQIQELIQEIAKEGVGLATG